MTLSTHDRADAVVRHAEAIQDMSRRAIDMGGEPAYCTEKLGFAFRQLVRALLIMDNAVGVTELKHVIDEEARYVRDAIIVRSYD